MHLIIESMRRAFADRARYLGDPAFNPPMPIARLISKEYAAALRETIRPDRASVSSPARSSGRPSRPRRRTSRWWTPARNAVSLTYTLEAGYGSKIVVPGAGFLLNNEMGDFNAGPGLTDADGLIGTEPNLAAPGKRMLSSMTPTIVAKDGQLFMVTGSPGGRTIINTVLHTILNVVDFGMNAQEAVDAARFYHQWLPDTVQYERHGMSPDTLAILRARGHTLEPIGVQGIAEVIVLDPRTASSTAATTGAPSTGERRDTRTEARWDSMSSASGRAVSTRSAGCRCFRRQAVAGEGPDAGRRELWRADRHRARTCASFGLRATYLGAVGDDEDGRRIRGELTARGDGSGICRSAPVPSATATILIDATGERMVLWHRDPALRYPAERLPAAVIPSPGSCTSTTWTCRRRSRPRGRAGPGIPVTCDIDHLTPVTRELLQLVSHPVFAERCPRVDRRSRPRARPARAPPERIQAGWS